MKPPKKRGKFWNANRNINTSGSSVFPRILKIIIYIMQPKSETIFHSMHDVEKSVDCPLGRLSQIWLYTIYEAYFLKKIFFLYLWLLTVTNISNMVIYLFFLFFFPHLSWYEPSLSFSKNFIFNLIFSWKISSDKKHWLWARVEISRSHSGSLAL